MSTQKSFATRFSCAVLAIAASVGFASTASAAGFQLTEQSVVGMGRSHAGAGIVGDDLSAVHYNAAGMTLLPGTQVSVAATYVDLDIEVHADTGNGFFTENGRDTPAGVPAMFVTHQINDSWWVGLGITSPYGMKVRYGNGWPVRERGISASILTVDINPNVAWKVTDWLSFGAGVSAMYTHSKIKNGLPGSYSALGQNLPFGGEFEFKGDDWMFTYNLGLMLSPSENLRFGVSYRSAAHVTARGDYYIRGNGLATGEGSGKGRLTTPETVYITGTWKATERIRLSALARWANWKNFDTMRFTMNDGSNLKPTGLAQGVLSQLSPGDQAAVIGGMQNKLGDLTLVNDWKSVWLLSLGADIDITDQWTIRGGIGLETDPIHNQQNRTALIPDTKRLWLTCGFSYKPTPKWQIDMAYGHIRGIGHRDFYNMEHQKVGKFDKMNAWMVGASATYRF